MTGDFSGLIGISYQDLNCWGLVKKFYQDILNIELSHSYDAMPSREETRDLIFSNRGNFSKVTTPEFGDIIIFRIKGIESHLGVFLEAGKFLHSIKETGSCVERISKWENLIEGFYRVCEAESDKA